MKKLMFDAIEAKLYVQRKRLPPKPLEKLEKGVLTRTQEVDSTDSTYQTMHKVAQQYAPNILDCNFLTNIMSALTLCTTCYRQKLTVWPGKLIS